MLKERTAVAPASDQLRMVAAEAGVSQTETDKVSAPLGTLVCPFWARVSSHRAARRGIEVRATSLHFLVASGLAIILLLRLAGLPLLLGGLVGLGPGLGPPRRLELRQDI